MGNTSTRELLVNMQLATVNLNCSVHTHLKKYVKALSWNPVLQGHYLSWLVPPLPWGVLSVLSLINVFLPRVWPHLLCPLTKNRDRQWGISCMTFSKYGNTFSERKNTCVLSSIWIFTTAWLGPRLLFPWDFSQQYWSGLPFPTPVNLPDLGIKPMFPASPLLARGFLTTVPPGKPMRGTEVVKKYIYIIIQGSRYAKISLKKWV